MTELQNQQKLLHHRLTVNMTGLNVIPFRNQAKRTLTSDPVPESLWGGKKKNKTNKQNPKTVY